MDCVLQGVTSRAWGHSLTHVLIKHHRDDERGDDNDDEWQRRGGGENAVETNAQVDPATTETEHGISSGRTHF